MAGQVCWCLPAMLPPPRCAVWTTAATVCVHSRYAVHAKWYMGQRQLACLASSWHEKTIDELHKVVQTKLQPCVISLWIQKKREIFTILWQKKTSIWKMTKTKQKRLSSNVRHRHPQSYIFLSVNKEKGERWDKGQKAERIQRPFFVLVAYFSAVRVAAVGYSLASCLRATAKEEEQTRGGENRGAEESDAHPHPLREPWGNVSPPVSPSLLCILPSSLLILISEQQLANSPALHLTLNINRKHLSHSRSLVVLFSNKDSSAHRAQFICF